MMQKYGVYDAKVWYLRSKSMVFMSGGRIISLRNSSDVMFDGKRP